MICPSSAPKEQGARPLSLPALRILRHFQRSNYAEAQRARLSSAVDHELEALMVNYLSYLLERRLNTPEFLKRVRDLA